MRCQLRPAGFLVVRTPYLPASAVLDLGGDLAGDAPNRAMEQPLRSRLLRLARRSDVHEALRTASPEFADRVAQWSGAGCPRSVRLERTLLAYLIRMSTCSTPLGLLAGYAIGVVTDQPEATTLLEIPSVPELRRHATLDISVLKCLAERLHETAPDRSGCRFVPNPTLYRVHGQFRYLDESRSGGNCTTDLVAVAWSVELQTLLDRAATAATLDELVEALIVVEPDVRSEEVIGFVGELVAAHLLVPDVSVTPTSEDPLGLLLDDFGGRLPTSVREALVEVRADVDLLNTSIPGQHCDVYGRVEDTLTGLGVTHDRTRLLRVNLSKPTSRLSLTSSVVMEVARGVELLHRVSEPRADALSEFRSAFVRRYGEGERVALVEVIDCDAGIGFAPWDAAPRVASTLVKGLDGHVSRRRHQSFTQRDALLLDWVLKLEKDGLAEWCLGESEISALCGVSTGDTLPLPTSFAALATILASDAAAIDAGRFRVLLRGARGPTAATLLGRFCRGDRELTRLVREHLRAEEEFRPDAVFAEIVHLPEDRAADVMVRPAVRTHEIPCFARPSVPPRARIEVADLEVHVEGVRTVLTSRRSGREVIPRLSAAHNYTLTGSLPLYQFLCAVQDQDAIGGLPFHFGALSGAAHLPRVVADRLVLAPERWRLGADALSKLAPGSVDAHQTVSRLREAFGLPRRVDLAGDGRSLPLDLDEPACCELLLHHLRSRSATLVESFLDGRQLAAAGPDGRFAHELVIPFLVADPAVRPPSDRPATLRSRPVDRVRHPGNDWLYVKLYCGPSQVRTVLERVVSPLVDPMTGPDVRTWFFVRAADPDWHLRLRVRAEPHVLRHSVEPYLFSLVDPLITNGSVWRTQIDTYERELARYGGPEGMEVSEALFCVDSRAALELLTGSGTATEAEAWTMTLVGLDALLTDLSITLVQKLEIVTDLSRVVAQDLPTGRDWVRQVGLRFRQKRSQVDGWLSAGANEGGDPWLRATRRVLERRSIGVQTATAKLKALNHRGRLTASMPALVGSYLHMHANRMLDGSINAQEVVLYEFLRRHYRAEIALADRTDS